MRSLARHLVTLFAALSLLLCIASGALRVRSVWWVDMIAGPVGNRAVTFRSEQGLIFLEVSPLGLFVTVTPPRPGSSGWRHESWSGVGAWSPWRQLGSRWWDKLGFGHYVGFAPLGTRIDQYVLPLYFIILLTGLHPALLPIVRWTRAGHRACAGLCRHCGYDLRATPDRCPECGAVPSALTVARAGPPASIHSASHTLSAPRSAS